MELKRWRITKRLIPILMMMVLFLTGCSITGQDPGPLDPRGTTGQEQFSLIILSTVVMGVVLLTVFALFFYVVFKFRAKKGDDSIPKQVEGNHVLEIVWTTIPVILLVILAVPTLAVTFGQGTDYSEDPDAIQVNVTAHQFWWEFEYPNEADTPIITAQELVIPVDTKVAFSLVSNDVVHSFWVPGIGGKIDTNPGQANNFYLEGTEIGSFKGKCAEFCGQSHALMDFNVEVVSEEDFEAWLDNMVTPPASVVSEDVAAGFELFQAQCMSCHAIDGTSGGPFPNLKGFANRSTVGGYLENTDENLFDWIKDPQAIKPGNTMPAVPLNDEEITAIVEYMRTLE